MPILNFLFLNFWRLKTSKNQFISSIWFENSLFGEIWPQSSKMATESFVQPFCRHCCCCGCCCCCCELLSSSPSASSSSSLLSLPVSLKFGLFHLNLSLFFFLFVFSPCSHILTTCLLSLRIGFHVCMLAGCMWGVVFSVWRTRRMPDASYNSTNKQTNKDCVVLSWEQD